MAWRLARSLVVLGDEIEQVAPGTTVWTIGDADHAARWSDHNPNECCDVVCAVDILSNAGLDLDELVDTITATDPPALKYVIYRDRIWFPQTGWQPYRGTYHTHVHVSVGWGPDGRSTGPYDDTSPWGLEGDMSMIGLRKGDSGQRVKGLQSKLLRAGFPPDGGVDGDYGPATSAAVLKMRKAHGSSVTDGDYFSGWANTQLDDALAKRRAAQAANGAFKEAKALVNKLADVVEALPQPDGAVLPKFVQLDLSAIPDDILVPVEPAGDGDDG